MTERIEGFQAMREALAAAGYTVTAEHTGGGVMTVYVYFADGTDLAMSDCFDGPGQWCAVPEVSETGEWLEDDEWVSDDPDAIMARVADYSRQHGGPLPA